MVELGGVEWVVLVGICMCILVIMSWCTVKNGVFKNTHTGVFQHWTRGVGV